tara:strand:+ start:2067 stop:2333 length:267 start_codon:yes stop_codon:yes gene_type:complete
MTKGDIVQFKPAKTSTKSSDGLVRMVKQYDSPCVVYQVIGYWAYLYRLMDGGIHVAPCSEHWTCVDVDLGMYADKLDLIGHLLEVGQG